MSTNNHSVSHERPPSNQQRRNVLGENLLTIVTIIGVIGKPIAAFNWSIESQPLFKGGTIFGLILKNSGNQWTEREIMYIQYPGDLFLRMLKCLIVPLIVSSITSAIGALDLSLSKKIALRYDIHLLTLCFRPLKKLHTPISDRLFIILQRLSVLSSWVSFL